MARSEEAFENDSPDRGTHASLIRGGAEEEGNRGTWIGVGGIEQSSNLYLKGREGKIKDYLKTRALKVAEPRSPGITRFLAS